MSTFVRSHFIFLGLIFLMLLALAVEGRHGARTAPFILKPNIPLSGQLDIEAGSRKPASLEIEPVAVGEVIPESHN